MLVAISKYRDQKRYPDLDSSLIDFKSFYSSLTSENGGDVPTANIHYVTTDKPFVDLPDPRPDDAVYLTWEPSKRAFTTSLEKAIQDNRGNYVTRRGARLYMYFVGHGFSADAELMESASLVPADVFGEQIDDIPGTVYMEGIRKMALYSEIVLIMDCCRTLHRTGNYSRNVFGSYASGQAGKVSVLSVYAVPKDGSAQERDLTGTNQPVGLLTYSFLRALKEIRPDVLGRVLDTAIDQYLAMNWFKWYPDNKAPPKPMIYVPPAAQSRIYFRSFRPLIEQVFSVLQTRAEDFALEIRSPNLSPIRGTFSADKVHWERPGDYYSLLDIELSEPGPDGRQTFTLNLLSETYEIEFAQEPAPVPPRPRLTFTPGGARVDL